MGVLVRANPVKRCGNLSASPGAWTPGVYEGIDSWPWLLVASLITSAVDDYNYTARRTPTDRRVTHVRCFFNGNLVQYTVACCYTGCVVN